MTAALKTRAAEPEERDDPANAMLAMVLANCEQMIALGYGAQLEARLGRLFPRRAEPARAAAPSAARTQRIIADGETALELSHGMEALRRYRDRLGPDNAFGRRAVETCLAVLLARLKGPAAPEAPATRETT